MESDKPIRRAWAFFTKQNQGFGGMATGEGSWGRAFTSARGLASVASSWRGKIANLEHWHDRLSRVQLDNRDAMDVIKYWDSPDTVFYVDPPYMPDTRISQGIYDCEVNAEYHGKLLELLLSLKGSVALSGYDHPAYEILVKNKWTVHKVETTCFAAGRVRGSKMQGKGAGLKHAKRTEMLWVKYRKKSGGLFRGI
jgi:DNA adenine methylase